MEELDLNLSNYSLNDLLNLFKLNLNFNSEEFKNAKKMVLMTHPDKSGLPAKYFQFYTKAYELLYRVYKFRVKDEEISKKSINNDYFSDSLDNKNKESDLIILQKIGLLNKDATATKGFSTKFNQMFEKYYVNLNEDEGYNEWLKSNEDEMPSNLSQSEVQRRMEEKRKNLRALVKVDELKEASYGGCLSVSSISDEKVQSYESPIFGNLRFDDLKNTYSQSIIPVGEEDFNEMQKYNNLNEIKQHRDMQSRTFDWKSETFDEKLQQRNNISDVEDCNRYYNLMKEQERIMELNKKFWKDLKQIAN